MYVNCEGTLQFTNQYILYLNVSNGFINISSFYKYSHTSFLTLCVLKCLLQKVQFSSVTQCCPTIYDPIDCSMPGFPIHHQLPELAQAYVQRVSDAIQPSHPLLSSSPTAYNLSQHQVLFQ